MLPDELKRAVQNRYALTAKFQGSCCGGGACGSDPVTSSLYDARQAGEVPEEALKASLGCGHPTLLVELRPGETVLDLGSGGGIDVLLSARRARPTAST